MNPPTHTHTDAPLIELVGAAVFAAERPGVATVENIDWAIRAGEFWVVAGLQSSGKSDLLNTAAGLQRPLRGRHAMFGEETASLSEGKLIRHRLRVGVLFENGGRVFSDQTVAQNIALPLRYHQNLSEAEVAGHVRDALEFAELARVADALPSRLHRNARQRAALVRALMVRPEILMLDNPLGGLDPRETRWWLDLLGKLAVGHPFLNGQPLTIVATADDMRPWLNVARQFGCLADGLWRALGGRDRVEACAEPIVRDLLMEGFD